eukprot:CAMPEP_0196803584 /NCGR_PEP_ID=MMETSP1362-20130617/2996_1 /TAXON_ID=163516 /ORGANISM="Leptocylindrus danicus, Strain CCMP1856" /LENGTH=222 /DNA_ID=CAMNT_0042175261 /DNA_START=43 /DNA_END=711 /DNA_ORIENTATION=-
MKIHQMFLLPAVAHGFVRSAAFQTSSSVILNIGKDMDLSGNDWKPEDGQMKATDVGDYFPEDYEADIGYTDGMMGSQAGMNRKTGPALPGMENLGADAIMMGGIEMSEDIPEGMEFIPASVPDGEIRFQAAASGSTTSYELVIKPMCMTFEDFFAAFAPSTSHPSLSVTPATGRMDRRGGEETVLQVNCDPRGQSGELTGDLVINLPEDGSKLSYKVVVTSF